jgi:hypothetical protein
VERNGRGEGDLEKSDYKSFTIIGYMDPMMTFIRANVDQRWMILSQDLGERENLKYELQNPILKLSNCGDDNKHLEAEH